MLSGIESNISRIVSRMFNENKINNPELEKAISEAIYYILSDGTILRALTKEITEIQDFERRRRERFRGL